MSIFYHGSENLFAEFAFDHIGKHGTSEGYGFYLTDNLEIAERYTEGNGYLYELDFHGVKSLNPNKRTITKTMFKKFVWSLEQKEQFLMDYCDVDYYGIHTAIENAWELLKRNENDVDFVCEMCNAYGDKEYILSEVRRVLGFDHIRQSADWGNQTLVILLVPDIVTINHITHIELEGCI